METVIRKISDSAHAKYIKEKMFKTYCQIIDEIIEIQQLVSEIVEAVNRMYKRCPNLPELINFDDDLDEDPIPIQHLSDEYCDKCGRPSMAMEMKLKMGGNEDLGFMDAIEKDMEEQTD